jgi:two-component system, OmpR family, phosphate regulon response regulator PhoB
MKIFILEDNIAIAQLVTLLLKRNGHEVEAFYNVKSFLNATNTYTPDMFILDVMLPDGNGLDIAREFKQTDLLKQVPILIMSANVDCTFESKNLNMVDYIAKPFDINDFNNRLENLLTMAKS